ncbi:MAG: leucine-rich repeat protein, partial [Clostridia bacterium]|nr:leucine-rich repeat protein [Clostridia bacterium]
YLAFLNAWGSSLGTNELLTLDGSAPEYIYVNGAILSDYGKTLYSVDESAVGTLILPDYVEKIAADSIRNENIDSIIFGKNFKEIENGAINTDNIKRLFFLGDTAAIESDSITAPSDGEDDVQVFVQSGVKNTFTSEWSAVMGDRADKIISADNMEFETKDGFTYLKTDGGAILFEAPKDITIFNIGSIQGVTFKEIGSNAFKGCKNLRFADLTASIKRIGKYAFRDCDSLEGVNSLSRDEITVDKWVFTQYNGFNNTLRYVVFNALYGYIDEEFQNINREIFFAPYNTYGYGDNFSNNNYILYYTDYHAGGYRIDHLDGDERIVYGYQTDSGFVVCSATKGIKGTITFPDETVMIHDYAFSECKNKFELKNYESITFISSMAFAESGLSGEYNFESLIWAFDGAFSYCENLTKVELPSLQTLQAMTFSGCTNLKEVVFGEELAMINSGSFNNCTSLKSMTLTTKTDEETGENTLVDLYNTNWFSPFEFGTGVNADSGLRIHIVGSATPQDYIEAWKNQFVDFFDPSSEEAAQIELEKLFGVYKEQSQTEQQTQNTDGEKVEGQEAADDDKNNDETNSENTNREEK